MDAEEPHAPPTDAPGRPTVVRPVVALQVHVLDAKAPQRVARAAATPAGLVIEGEVSAGRRGWRLSGHVMRRRRRLLLQLVARRDEAAPTSPDIERLAYRALVTGLPTGEFEVHQSVLFLVPGLSTQLPEPQFVGVVVLAG